MFKFPVKIDISKKGGGVYIYHYEDYNYGIPNDWVMDKEKI